jgi:hypothetical protein
MKTGRKIAAPLLAAVWLVSGASFARGEAADLFKVIILARAVTSDWHDIYKVSTEFQSFEQCEAARLALAEDFRQFLEMKYSQAIKVDSKCIRDDSEI